MLFKLATNVRGGLGGIGGNPGESVVIKGGVTTAEPQSMLSEDVQGCVYLIIGTDSGFEGFTEYYLDGFEILAVSE